MATIQLRVEKEWRVVANSLDAAGHPDKRGGNLDLQGGSKIVWEASPGPGWVAQYKVKFRDSARPSQTAWPFVDAQPADQVLRLNRGASVTLTTLGGGLECIKYDVEVESSSGGPGVTPEPLDPMIIIRPNKVAAASHQATDGVLFGVTCAVVGAAAGALLTALWT
jgi:hypothetical protein